MMKRKNPQPMICERHQAPLVEIDGRLECAVEYMEACLLGQRVVDVVKEDGVVYHIYDDGHAIPLLCSCCGAPLHPPDMDFERQDIIGRRFDAVRTAPVKLKNGKLGVELQLLLAPRNFKENGVEVSLAVAVALEMRHPENCPRRPGK